MSIAGIRARRAELSAAYTKARRLHRAQAALSRRLQDATTALLQAEIRATKPKLGRPRNPRPSNPDLFPSEARP